MYTKKIINRPIPVIEGLIIVGEPLFKGVFYDVS